MIARTKKELRVRGVSVSEGIAIGTCHFLKSAEENVPDFPISLTEVDAEIARYRKALFSSKQDLCQLRNDLAMEGSDEAMSFIESHIQMLDDPMITVHMEGKIRQMLRNTESVFRSVITDYEAQFTDRVGYAGAFFQERLIDVLDVSKRILCHLRSKQDAKVLGIPAGSIVLSQEIAPSYVASAHAGQIGAFVSRGGGGNSHAALIARAKGIPYVADIDVDTLEQVSISVMIVDGYEGIVILNPTEKTIKEYEQKQLQHSTRYQLLLEEDHLISETIDGYHIHLYVNVGSPYDLEVFPYTHEGVGLFRTEYLFLETKEFHPSGTYQEEIYREMIKKMEGRPLVIRAFDLGGDKIPASAFSRKSEPNPVLGSRGIRFLLKNIELFKIQLRAIFKAAKEADVRLLLPLISDINELHLSKKIIQEVREELSLEQLDVPQIPLGVMIEVPSAVMLFKTLAESADFLSIGTNDLVQYTLGVDRANPLMHELSYPAHPSVLRMIKMMSTEAKRQNKPLTICGEMASNVLFLPLLIGLGLDRLSIAPRYLPLIKQTIRKWTIIEAYALAQEVLQSSDPNEISKLLIRAQKNKEQLCKEESV